MAVDANGIGAIFSRVTGANPSHLFGTLGVLGEANLFLLNPNGILFGPNAQLDMRGSFVASTANSLVFSNGSQYSATTPNAPPILTVNVSPPVGLYFEGEEPGAVVNTGNLAVESGENLTLVGGTVVSTGKLAAPGGEVSLLAIPEEMAAGGKPLVEVTEAGQLLNLSATSLPSSPVSAPPTLSELLTCAGNLADLTVTDNGEVKLTAIDTSIPTEAGVAIASGNIDVSGETAGKVQVLGEKVGLFDAEINASGTNGGGTVLIGGDYQGIGSILNADRTFISRDSVIKVDAIENGDGGRAIAWANGTTGFYGRISARGGSNSGNGGFSEVSGKENLIFRGEVDTSAPLGNFGTLLLDPKDIIIVNSPAAPDDGQLPTIGFGDNPGATYTISNTALQGQKGNVVLEATNDIRVNTGVSLNFANGNGDITFTADADMDGIGDFVMNPLDTIETSGRDISITAASITAGIIDTNGGNIRLTSTVGDIITDDVESEGIFAGGQITLVAGGNINTGQLDSSNFFGDGGLISLEAKGGDIRVRDSIKSDSFFGDGGVIDLEANGNIRVSNKIESESMFGDGGNITFTSHNGTIDTTASNINSTSVNRNGGNITIDANSGITTGNIESFSVNGGNAGEIILKSDNGAIDTTAGMVNSGSVTGNGAKTTISAEGDITTANIASASQEGNSGEILLESHSGDIDTTAGTLNSGTVTGNGAKIIVSAEGDITTAYIFSNGPQNDSGEISITSNNGKIDTTAGILVSASDDGDAGKIDITAKSDIITGDINAFSVNGNGAAIAINSTQGTIDTTRGRLTSASKYENAGIVELTAKSDITTGNIQVFSIDGDGGAIALTSEQGKIDTTPGTLTSTSDGNAGEIDITTSGDIMTGDIQAVSNRGNGGAIAINSNQGKIDTTSGTLTSASDNGDAGIIDITGNSDITTGDIQAVSNRGDGGAIALISNQGTIDTTSGTLTSASDSGDAGIIDITTSGDIMTGDIQAVSNRGDGGAIALISNQGTIDTTPGTITSASDSGNAGIVDITGKSDITTGDIQAVSNRGNGGAIALISNQGTIDTTPGTITSASNSGDAGEIEINGNSDITTGNIQAVSNRGDGGAIALVSNQGTIDTTPGTITSASNSGDAGKIELIANRDITIKDILAVSNSGNGSEITLTSFNGAIETTGGIVNSGSLLQNGGDITFTANDNITIPGIINSNGIVTGGDITIESNNGGINGEGLIVNSGRLSRTQIRLATDNGFSLPPQISNRISGKGGAIAISGNDGINFTTAIINANGASGAGGAISFTSSEGAISLEDTFILTNTFVGQEKELTFEASSVSFSNSSAIVQTRTNGEVGNIEVTATEFVDLNQGSLLSLNNRGAKTNGNLTIDTPRLTVRDGSLVSASTESVSSSGRGGTLEVINANLVEIIGTSADGLIPSALVSISGRVGNAGDVRISTNQLILRDGGSVSGASVNEGLGGNVFIEADSVIVTGTSENQLFGSTISVDTLGSGKAGSLEIITNQLLVQDGGVVSASTFGTGDAGNIIIKAKEEISVSGTSLDNQIKSGIYAQSYDEGQAGSIDILVTGNLMVQNEAKITVNSEPTSEDSGNLINKSNALIEALRRVPEQDIVPPDFAVARGSGTSDAGNIIIDANHIFLNNQGQITAVTSSGEGGNINIDVWDLILMRHNSFISTTAGTAPGGGNGGNITIRAPFIVAVPDEDSDITANAFTGNGGRITIFSQAIFGLEFRPRLTPRSDITVSSQFGLDGTVELNTLGIDPSLGFFNLSMEAVEPEVKDICQGNGGQPKVELYDIGRAGIAPTPHEPFDPDFVESESPASEVNALRPVPYRCDG
ncbi:MAG: filamentous hemagglutinin N-terminal domain-containing protein [Symploca sp. SIO1C2]|nr:filamentous hemagglutinin N-terminal domain-containing protein [Symploca sp. SIO1C2]